MVKESFYDHGDEHLASIAENLTAVHQELYTITIAVQLDL
jgi:hypothetical protein